MSNSFDEVPNVNVVECLAMVCIVQTKCVSAFMQTCNCNSIKVDAAPLLRRYHGNYDPAAARPTKSEKDCFKVTMAVEPYHVSSDSKGV